MFSCTFEKSIFGLISEGQIKVPKRKSRKIILLYIFFDKFWGFKVNIHN
jgi:hypothetical protein